MTLHYGRIFRRDTAYSCVWPRRRRAALMFFTQPSTSKQPAQHPSTPPYCSRKTILEWTCCLPTPINQISFISSSKLEMRSICGRSRRTILYPTYHHRPRDGIFLCIYVAARSVVGNSRKIKGGAPAQSLWCSYTRINCLCVNLCSPPSSIQLYINVNHLTLRRSATYTIYIRFSHFWTRRGSPSAKNAVLVNFCVIRFLEFPNALSIRNRS